MKLLTYTKIDKLTRSQTMTAKKTNKNQVNKKAKNRSTSKLLSLALIFIMVIISVPKMALAQLFGETSEKVTGSPNATIKLPDTQYVENTVDLRVKALGGEVKLNRSWTNGRWYINPAWATLRFVSDPLGNITAIDRAGTIYQLANNGQLVSNDKDNNTNLTQVKKAIYSFEQVYIAQTDTGWRWYDLQGNWINYDKGGRILEYGDKNNIKVSFILDKENRRTAIKDHHGEVVYTFSYDDQDHLVKVIDREGRTVSYEWSGDRLTQVTDVLGNKWLYGYDANGQLNQRTEPDGGVIKIDYSFSVPAPKPAMNSGKDGGEVSKNAVVSTASANRDSQLARVAKITDKTGAVTIYNTQYNRTNKQYTISIDDPMGKKTVSQFDAQGRMLTQKINDRLIASYQRDDKNHLVKYTDQRGLTTIYQYDQASNLKKIIHPNKSVESYEYDGQLNKITRFIDVQGNISKWQYDNKGNLIKKVEAEGKPEQRIISWSYDSYGQPIKVVLGGENSAITLQQSFDKYGNVSSYIDGNGNKYQYSYNTQGQIITITNPLNNSWKTTYNLAGYPVQKIDPLNHITNYTSDALGRLTSIADPLGNKTTYSYSFDSNGWQIRKTNALNGTVTYYMDYLGNTVKATIPSGLQVQQFFDSDSHIKRAIGLDGNSLSYEYGEKGSGLEGLIVKAVYPTYSVTYKYNELGKMTESNLILDDNNSLVTKISYNEKGLPIAIIDPANRILQNEYDAYGKLLKQVNGLGTETQLFYDILGNIVKAQDANGNIYSFEYDNNNNLIKKTKALGTSVQYIYDEANQLIEKIEASGDVVKYKYDAVGRKIKEDYFPPQQTTPLQAISYLYNNANQLIEVIQSGSTNTRFVYELDKLGRKIKEHITYEQGANIVTKTIGYNYDVDGNLTGITYPDASMVTYSYDKNRLIKVQIPNGDLITWQDYQWKKPTKVNFPGVKQTVTYDALQRLTTMKSITKDNLLILDRQYHYDKAGNIIKLQTEDGDKMYQYDLLDRLTLVKPSNLLQQKGIPVEAYSYDAISNRIGSINQAGEWQYKDNKLIQWNDGADQHILNYAANGNVSKEIINNKEFIYTYGETNRLISVKADNQEIASYQYDPFGRRISKIANGVTTYFIYSDGGLIAELDEKGNIKVAYGWHPDAKWGSHPLWQANVSINQNFKTADYSYLFIDDLGTPQLATNSNGQIVWKALSEAFGSTLLDSNNQIIMNLRFAGQYYDQETGLHYNYFRDYNPKLGRYIQTDPIGLHGGWNTYNYANANPLRWIDPNGLRGVDVVLKETIMKYCGDNIASFVRDNLNLNCWERFPTFITCAVCCIASNAPLAISACKAECGFDCVSEGGRCFWMSKLLEQMSTKDRDDIISRLEKVDAELSKKFNITYNNN